MTSTSSASGCRASWRKWRVSGRLPSRRCSVATSVGTAARTASGSSRPPKARPVTAFVIDSLSRAAALPVGAAMRMRSARPPPCGASASCCSSASSLTTVVVLPVPGPPVTIANALRAASAQASFCQSSGAASDGGNSTASARRSAASPGAGSAPGRVRASIAARMDRSNCQYRRRYSRVPASTSGVAPAPSPTSRGCASAARHRGRSTPASSWAGVSSGPASADTGPRTTPAAGSASTRSGSASAASSTRQAWPRPSWWLASAAASSSSASTSPASRCRNSANARSSSRSQPASTQRSICASTRSREGAVAMRSGVSITIGTRLPPWRP